eukprot:gnl/MRDRNA2_/MRDRNA2_112247_c0_seq1.p1 gnl/MRDRNA2_/MRDRNA2_112247_c0~~gnl/MRDRNA2_/MRDRNA2_112247_c0_seq1.p1  ORF type:complete len:357 (+),score=67.50 gnl/MRDRNA2_/MRDRNA2_112247_c0_seq1:71-1072(+)
MQDLVATRSKSARGATPWRPTEKGKTFEKHLHRLQYGLPPFKSQQDMSRKLGRKSQQMFLEGLRNEKRIIAQQKEIIAREKTGDWKRQKAMEVQNPSQACNAAWKNADSVPRVFSTPQPVAGADSELRWQERQEELGLRRRASSAPPVRSFRLGTPYWKEKKPGTSPKTAVAARTPRVPNCCGSGTAAPGVSYHQYTAETPIALSRDQEYFFAEEDDDLSQYTTPQHMSKPRGFGLGYQGHPEERAHTSLGFAEPSHSSRKNSGAAVTGAGTAHGGSPQVPEPQQRPTTPQSRPVSARPYSARRAKRFSIALTVRSPRTFKDDSPCPQPCEKW